MKKYLLKYWYLDQGMEGVPDEFPETEIEAMSRDEAFYKYHQLYFSPYNSFEEFMSKEKYIREWATSCEEINQRNEQI